jgi:glutamate racemase
MDQPIGIFDSGLGGLTVLKHLAKEFPQESFCYLGDIARLPYGNKSSETIHRYAVQILKFLKSQNVKAIVIACNSASTVFLEQFDFEGVPLLNVIGPGAEAALKITPDKKIGVLGTSATIRSKAYTKTLLALDPQIQVIEKACPLFVPLVEEGFINDPITRLVAEKYLHEMKQEKIKTVILGCTHYPVLKNDLLSVLGPQVHLVESGEVLANKINELIQSGSIPASSDSQNIRICITDLTDQFEQLAGQLMGEVKFSSLEKVVL